MEKLITVIIPCYNVESYIERAVNSIMQQNFDSSKIEIIAINDGSKDNTLDKLKKLKEQFPDNLVVISRENKGMAKSRDEGVEKTETPYFCFLDADDYLEDDFFEKTYSEIEDGNYDIVVTESQRVNEEGMITQRFATKGEFPYTKYILMTAWGKLYSTNFVKKNNLHALNNLFGEDIYFLLDAFNKGARVKNINYIGYNWFINQESVTSTVYKKFDERMAKSIVFFIEKILLLREDARDKELFDYFIAKQFVNRLLSRGRYASQQEFISLYTSLVQSVEKEDPKILKNHLVLVGPKGESKKVRIIISVFLSLHRLRLIPLFAKIYCKG